MGVLGNVGEIGVAVSGNLTARIGALFSSGVEGVICKPLASSVASLITLESKGAKP